VNGATVVSRATNPPVLKDGPKTAARRSPVNGAVPTVFARISEGATAAPVFIDGPCRLDRRRFSQRNGKTDCSQTLSFESLEELLGVVPRAH
jgi:hypothetical protein